MKHFLIGAIMGLSATAALAHSPLELSMPADKAVLAIAPTSIVMDFKGSIRLTRVSVTHADNSPVPLDLTGFDGFISDYDIPMQPVGPGVYVIEWRGLGVDGHALNGSFSFMVE